MPRSRSLPGLVAALLAACWVSPAVAQPDRCVTSNSSTGVPSVEFKMHRPGALGFDAYYRDLEFAWDTLFAAKMGDPVRRTLRKWAEMLVDGTNISPLAPDARGLELVHNYFRREGIDWTPVLSERPIRLGMTGSVTGYAAEDRGHVDVYLTVPDRLSPQHQNRNLGGSYPSGWTVADEDVTSGLPSGTTRPFNSIALDGPPIGQEVDTLGTGWARPRTSYQTYFHHEFQHALPPDQGGSTHTELWSAAAEVVGGHFDFATPFEFPYNFVFPEVYQARTAFMAYLAYNFPNADTSRTLSGVSDDLLFKWSKARTSPTSGLIGLSSFLSDANCATCATKQYFRPAGVPLSDYERVGVLLHNWRVAMFANNSAIEEGQFGFPAWSGFAPSENVKAWKSFAGTYADDVDALPSVVTLTSSDLTQGVSLKHVRSLHGGSRPLAISQHGANYWVLRAGSGLTSTDRKLAIRITPLSALKLANFFETPTGGRLQVSLVKYSHEDTTASEESILWRHPEWISSVTPISFVDVDSITSEVEIIVPDFGASTKAAVLVMSVTDGRAQRWRNLLDGFTPDALRYRLDLSFRANTQQQVAERLFSPVDSLRATPAWAPDGNTLVYSAREPSGRVRLWRESLSGGGPVTLNSQSMDQFFADWSPRGDLVAYEAIPNPGIGSETDLYLTPSAPLGSNPSRVTSLPGCESFPAFQPNGQGIAYLHTNGAGWSLRWISIDGTGDVLLASSSEFPIGPARPRWSVDGSRIYIAGAAPGNRIAWVPRQGGTPALVPEFDIPVKGFDLHPGTGPLAAASVIPLPVTTPASAPPLALGWMALYTPDAATRDTAFRMNVLAHDMDSPRFSHDGTKLAVQGRRPNGEPAMFWGRITDNMPPLFSTIDDQFGTACLPLQFNLPATDPEGQALTWQMYYKPPGSQLIQNNVFRWQYPAVGVFYTLFRVMDAKGAVDTRVVRIAITDGGYCEDPLSGGGGSGGGYRSVEVTSARGPVGTFAGSPMGSRNSFLDGATEGQLVSQDASLPPLPVSAAGLYEMTLSSGSPSGADVDLAQLVSVDHPETMLAVSGPGGLTLGRPAAAISKMLLQEPDAIPVGDDPVLVQSGAVIEVSFAPTHETRGVAIRCQQARGAGMNGEIEVLTSNEGVWSIAGRVHPRRAMDRIALTGFSSDVVRLRFTAPTILGGVERILWSPTDQGAFVTRVSEVESVDGAEHPLMLHVADGEQLHVDPNEPRVLRFAAPELMVGHVRSLFLRVAGRTTPAESSLRTSEHNLAPVPTSATLALGRVEPNPAVGLATFSFSLAVEGQVDLEVFNLQGARVRTLINQRMGAGTHRLDWDGLDGQGGRAPTGTYYIRLASNGGTLKSRFVLLH